jgi:formiminotetrahydrofolate cyclodeaminase
MHEGYAQRPLADFLTDAAAGRPTPGGGAVAALCGALASTMASMAANFTVGKKKFADVQTQIQDALARLEQARDRMLALLEQDMACYAQVGAAYGMPRDTPEQKSARRAAIQDALKAAMAPPAGVAECCVQVLGVCAELAGTCNPNLLSDVGCAAVLAEGALAAAQINVRVNLALIKDEALVADARRRLEAERQTARQAAARVAAAIDEKM